PGRRGRGQRSGIRPWSQGRVAGRPVHRIGPSRVRADRLTHDWKVVYNCPADFAALGAVRFLVLFSPQEIVVSQVETRLPYKVADLSLARWGRKEIMLAENE